MKMYKISAIALLAFSLVSAAYGQQAVLRGKVEGLSGKIDVNKVQPQGPSQLGKISPDSSGGFSYVVDLSEPGFYQLWNQAGGYLVMVLHPGDTVDFDLDGTDIGSPRDLGGSPDSRLALEIVGHGKVLKAYRDSLQRVYQQYINTPLYDSVSAVLMTQFREGDLALRHELELDLAEYGGSLALLFYTDYLDMDADLEVMGRLLESVGRNYPNDSFYRAIKARYDKVRLTAKGTLAPDIALKTPEGDTLRLSSLRGQYVLVDFWAGWCGPCRKENPHLVKVYHKYKDKGFEIYGVSLDSQEASWLSAIEKDQLVWFHVSDLKGWQSAAAQTYGVTSIPNSFLLDPEGRIIAKNLRSEQLDQILGGIFPE